VVAAVVLYLGVGVPADGARVPHFPVLDELGCGPEPGSVGQVLVQKDRRHGGDGQRTRTLGTPAERERVGGVFKQRALKKKKNLGR